MSGIGSASCYPDALVGKFLGTAYDDVKKVADNLDDIVALAGITGDVTALLEIKDQIIALVPEIPMLQTIADHLDEIINGTKPASSITYNGITVQEALDQLLYSAITISNFILSQTTAEIGSSIQSINMTWALNRSGSAQKINGLIIDADLRSYTYNIPFATDTTFTIEVDDLSHNPVTASAQVRFLPKVYWGVSGLDSLTNAQILALGSDVLTSTKTRSVVYDATGGAYPYYVYPASFGNPSIKVNGLSFSDYTVTQQTVTNASNYAQLYNVLRFNNLQTGSNIQVDVA